MTVELLIHAIVRQTMVLIAQLATVGGRRAPLAQIADQVFVDLVRELERQGLSRNVSADMFGLGLRTYRRKIQRLSESSTERGRSLWEVVLEFIRNQTATRSEIFARFSRDDEGQLRSVLRDLCETGLVLRVGRGTKARYRVATDDELAALPSTRGTEGLDDLIVSFMYREGPSTLAEIAARAQVDVAVLAEPIQRLVAQGRVQALGAGPDARFQAAALIIPLGSAVGWEGAVFDHYKAMVGTVLVKLRAGEGPTAEDQIGGSTYTIDVWPGHPLEEEVLSTLRQFRSTLGDLRQRVAQHSKSTKRPKKYSRVIVYGGQCVISEDGS